MNFIGQSSLVKDFKDKMENQSLSHAYAFTGPVGIGKRTFAGYLSQMLLCEDLAHAPCGHCRSCRCFEAEGHPRLTIIRNETQKILIKQIRGLIEDIGMRPSSGRKVYVIEEADRMTPDAQNCLLKTLEEPPSYAVILLTTAYYESLLTTVRSRTVQIKMKPYKEQDIRDIVLKKGVVLKGKEHLLAWSQGNPGKALQLMNDEKFSENREKVLQFLFEEGEFPALEFNLFLSKRKESFLTCMDIMESVYRDALLVLFGQGDGLINSDKKDKIVAYANRYKPIELTEKIAIIQEMRSNLKRNMNYQLAVDTVTLEV